MIKLYTDGACQVHKGQKGGWAYVLVDKDITIQGNGSILDTTNNKMEIVALLKGLETLNQHTNDKSKLIQIYSDSQYVINSAGIWVHNWVKTNFRKKKNKEYWLHYLKLSEGWNIEFNWVRGHSGDKYNEICDQLATEAIQYLQPEKYLV